MPCCGVVGVSLGQRLVCTAVALAMVHPSTPPCLFLPPPPGALFVNTQKYAANMYISLSMCRLLFALVPLAQLPLKTGCHVTPCITRWMWGSRGAKWLHSINELEAESKVRENVSYCCLFFLRCWFVLFFAQWNQRQ